MRVLKNAKIALDSLENLLPGRDAYGKFRGGSEGRGRSPPHFFGILMGMRAWLVRQWCEPDEMEWAEVATPQPAPGEVRVRNRAAALNFFDVLQIRGKYQVKPPFPFTPGAEIAGVIEAVGEGVTG